MKHFDDKQSKALVDGILKGYKDYLAERREKKQMKVSSGYAFTKGNHIDDQVAKSLNQLIDSDEVKKAGESWEYLKFDLTIEGDRCFFLVKNASRISRSFQKGKYESEYLVDYSKTNRPFLSKIRQTQSKIESEIQLLLWETKEEEQLQNIRGEEYDRFYVVIYETDSKSKEIVKVEVVVPDSDTRVLHMVQDLSSYIATSDVVIELDEYSAVVNEEETFSDTGSGYDYTVPAVEKENM